MTEHDDDMTAALTRTLRSHAAHAPSLADLPEKAMAIASRRRRRRINASIAAVAVLAVAIPVAVVATVGGGAQPVAHQGDPTWRWESYRSVQVQVPPGWEYGVPGPAWCTAPPEGVTPRVRLGAVGRPGAIPAIMCPSEYPPANERENWLTFDSRDREGERRFDAGWVEETRRVDGVFVTVFAKDAALRTAILDTAQPIVGTDRYGCPVDHPLAENPAGYRPDPAGGGLPQAEAVESISVCRYDVETDGRYPLLGSGRIAGVTAKDVVAAIRSAPAGEGPDEETAGPGREVVVLRVDTVDGVREVVMRYTGKPATGFDDGVTKHELTADAIRPLFTGAACPTEMSLAVAQLLDG